MKIIFVLNALLLFILVGCSNQKKLEKAIEKMDNSDNMTVRMIMDNMTEDNSIEFTMKLDGKTEYIYSDFGLVMEQFIVTEGGERYLYTYIPQFQDEWFREPYENDPNAAEAFVEYDSLNSDWFVYDDGIYILEDDYYVEAFGEGEVEHITRFIIRLDGEDIIMEMDFEENDEEATIVFTFYDIGKTTIDLSPIE